jgi:hypothetical protein
MMGPAGMMDWDNFSESFPAYLTIAVMPLTYSIANGVVAGLLCWLLIDVCTRPVWLRYASALVRKDDSLTRPLVGGAMGRRTSSVTASPHAVCRPTTPISEGLDRRATRATLEVGAVRTAY